jgi:hypothetical protein
MYEDIREIEIKETPNFQWKIIIKDTYTRVLRSLDGKTHYKASRLVTAKRYLERRYPNFPKDKIKITHF